jgi:hypothetical protein
MNRPNVLLGIKRVGLTMHRSLPVFLYEQTPSDTAEWSVSAKGGRHSRSRLCFLGFDIVQLQYLEFEFTNLFIELFFFLAD